MNKKDCVYVNEHGQTSFLYCQYYLYERLILQKLLEAHKINFSGNHFLFYLFFLENINLTEFRQSNQTIASKIGISESSIKRLKKDFQKIKILTLQKKSFGSADVFKFKRIIKNKTEFNLDSVSKDLVQNELGREIEMIQEPSSNLSTNINNQELKTITDLIELLKNK